MPRRLVALTGAVVVAAAVLAHAASLRAGFVYDDHRFVVHNDAIASLSDPGRFFTDPRTASAEAGVEPDVYRPLRTLHFAVDRALFGLEPMGWHLGNVVLHALCSALVGVLLLRVLAPRAPGAPGVLAAGGGALLFAVHPVASEAVAWVSSRGDLLAVLLVLLALETMRAPGLWRTAAGAGLVLLACLAKESAVAAPAFLVLRDLALPRASRPPARTTALRGALLLAVAVGYLALRHAAMAEAGGRPLAQVDLPPGGRAAVARTMLAGVAWYARALLWPFGFRLEDDVLLAASLSDPAVAVGAGILATALLAGARALRRRDGALALACLGPLAALVPVSNVLVPLKAFVAERFLYPALPFVALLCALGGLGLARFLAARGLPRLALPAAAAVAVVGLAAAAHAREAAWRDERAVWEAVRARDPSNPRAYEGLGFEWFRLAEARARDDDLRGAEEAFRAAERHYATYLESAPDDGKSIALVGDLFGRVARELERRAGPVATADDDLARLSASLPGTDELDPSTVTTRITIEGAGYARVRQIEAYQRALAVWERVGLARGRGWPALYRRTAELLREVAANVGALGTARLANELLWRDDLRAGSGPRFAQRRARVLLARIALAERPPPQRPPAADVAAGRARVRAALLRDVGLDPNLPDPTLRVALLPAVSAVLDERGDDVELRRYRATYLIVRARSRGGDAALADLRQAADDLRWLLARDPQDAAAAGVLRRVEAEIGSR